MILKMFTIYDSKGEVFDKPFYLRTTLEAIRGFTDAINSGNSLLSSHPEDFTLHELATFNTLTGECVITDSKTLGTGVDFKKTSN